MNPKPSVVHSIFLLLRLGGSNRQPRPDFLRGPREQDNNVAATHSPPGPTDPPEVKFHPANGTAESPVRITPVLSELCALKTAFLIVRPTVEMGSQLLPQLAMCVYFYHIWLSLLICMWTSRAFLFQLCSFKKKSDNGFRKFKRLLMQKLEVNAG